MIPKILFSVPIFSGVEPAPYFSHLLLQRRLQRSEIEGKFSVANYVQGPRVAIRRARNQACQMAIDTRATHLAMLDDDMIVAEDALEILIDANKPVIGALCFTQEGNPCSFVYDGCGGEKFDPDPPLTGLYERAAIGSGLILISTEVLKALPAPWFYFDQTARTMDVNFCRAAREAGFSVWCSADAKIQQVDHSTRLCPTRPINANPAE